MADSSTTIQNNTQAAAGTQNPFYSQALQFDETAGLAAPANSNEASTFSPLLTPTDTTLNSNVPINDSLITLNTRILSIFNEVGNEPRSPNATGNLSAQQLQELGVLQQDLQLLEQAAALGIPLPLTENGTTLDLSASATALASTSPYSNSLDLAFDTTSVLNASLTPAQIQQAASVLAPQANQPLTADLLLQIQAQLQAGADLNPLRFTLNNIFMIMSAIAAMQPSQTAVKATVNEETSNNVEEQVSPVEAIDRVAVEDSKII